MQAGGRGFTHQVVAQVNMVDENNSPVPNATVSGDWRRNDSPFKSGASGITGALGVVVIESGRIENSSSGDELEFCVTGVAHSSLGYVPVENDETCDAITLP